MLSTIPSIRRWAKFCKSTFRHLPKQVH